jgi:hypothetical protein
MSRPADRDRLARLLGPAEPELSCEQCFDALDACVERELAGTDLAVVAPLMRAHLEGCPACREDHDGLIDFLRSRR